MNRTREIVMETRRQAALAGMAAVMLAGGHHGPPAAEGPTVLTTVPSYAEGINDAGWVVGYTEDVHGWTRAFVARPGEAAVDLGTLGGLHSKANAVSDRGVVVGSSDTATPGEQVAFRWTATGGMQRLPAPAGQPASAAAVNEAGTVVGTVGGRAAVWRRGATEPVLLPGRQGSEARDINERGQIVGLIAGTSPDPTSPWRVGALWEPDRATDGWTPIELPTPPDPQLPDAEANSINDCGEIVGQQVGGEHQRMSKPVRWSRGTHTGTGLQPDAAPLATAYDNNNRGTIVGLQAKPFVEQLALAWVRRHGRVERRVIDAPFNGNPAAINDHDVVAYTAETPDGLRAVRLPLRTLDPAGPTPGSDR
jgi:probable HAF family extracellular repeat protein